MITEISDHNKLPHHDIEMDLLKIKDGLFTFVLRVNRGNIVDYTLLENVSYGKYKNK